MPLLDAGQSLLLVIDAQPGFYTTQEGFDSVLFDATLARISWVAGVAASLNVPAVVTEEDAARNGPTAPSVVDRLPDATPVFAKVAFAVPDNPEILDAVSGSGRTTAVLVGLETDVCVAHSALRLRDMGWRVVAVDDAVYSPARAHHNGLRRMAASGVELLSAKELFYDWLRSFPRSREFHRDHPALTPPPPGIVL